jgi:hypothetical protein
MVYDADPSEFLTYVRDAAWVLTNSFHGTVFSILFQKKFYSVYGTNGRIEHLLQVLGLEEQHIQHTDEMNLDGEIDYSQSEERMKQYQRKSVEYLERALT